jgi:pimeloyl-ACP methyl ester carboxylesterase
VTEDEIIKAGVAAIKSGDMTRAASIFAQVVKLNPSSERGWFLLGMSCSTTEQREYCLRRVVAINPNNQDAKRQLASLSSPNLSAPSWATKEPTTPIKTPRPSTGASTPAFTPPPNWGTQQPKPPASASKPAFTSVPDWAGQESKPPVNPPKPPTAASKPAFTSPPDWAAQESNPPARPPVSPSKPAFTSAPPWAEQEYESPVVPPRPSASTPSPSTPLPRNPSPFVFDDSQDMGDRTFPAVSPFETSAQVPVKEGQAETPDKSKAGNPQKKKINNIILVTAILSALVLIVCGLGAAYILLSTRTNQAVAPVAPMVVSSATLAPTYTPTPVPTPTLVAPLVLPSPLPTQAYQPSFEAAECRFDVPKGVDVRCGYAVVPENRTGDTSRTIKLSVAVFHSTNQKPDPIPVMFLQGGPGAEAVKLSASAYATLVYPFLDQRDFIAFDQRGTGLSEPVLNCDELKKVYQQDIHGLIPPGTRNLVYSNAFVSCNGLMKAQGVDLNAYSTYESAADVKDILGLLGYKKVDLYGASYGTRLAQVVMRDHPEIVNSAILDSVVPIDSSLYKSYPVTSEDALNVLFETCKNSSKCNEAYPDLENIFWGIVDKLDAKPVTVTTSVYPVGSVTESITGSSFMSIVTTSIKNSAFISTAPQTIYRFGMGDYSTLIATQYSLPFAFDDISPGLYISMMCHENVLSTTLEDIQSVPIRHASKDYDWLPFYGSVSDVFKTCKTWGSKGPFDGENAPLTSDIPTLIITGKYDPITPPSYAQQVAKYLSNNYYFEFSNLGHVPTASDTTGCAMSMTVDFLDNPETEPDSACMNQLGKVRFEVPYTGSPEPLFQSKTVKGVTVSVPQNWVDLGDGFFFRGNSTLDFTQIGVVQARVSSSELKNWFSLGAYGYRGLDAAPVSAGQHDINGLNWTLYTSTSDGRPVDIAMADYGTHSVVVMMFSHLDERDALYKTVFLHMVDSIK